MVVSLFPRRACVRLGGEVVLGHQHVTSTSVNPLFLFPPASLKMESFIPGRRITFWEVNLSSPEIPPTVL